MNVSVIICVVTFDMKEMIKNRFLLLHCVWNDLANNDARTMPNF